jgi:hypothetical protein
MRELIFLYKRLSQNMLSLAMHRPPVWFDSQKQSDQQRELLGLNLLDIPYRHILLPLAYSGSVV